jgi:hypothetical protein
VITSLIFLTFLKNKKQKKMSLDSARKLPTFSFSSASQLLLTYIDRKLQQSFNGACDLENKLEEYFYAKKSLRKHSAHRFLLDLCRTLFPSIFREAHIWLQKRVRTVRYKERTQRENILNKVRSLTSEKVKIVLRRCNQLQLVTIKEIQTHHVVACPSFHSVFLPPPFRPATYYRQILQLSKNNFRNNTQWLQIKDFNDNPILDASLSWYVSQVLPPALSNIVLEYWFTPNSLRPLRQFNPNS